MTVIFARGEFTPEEQDTDSYGIIPHTKNTLIDFPALRTSAVHEENQANEYCKQLPSYHSSVHNKKRNTSRLAFGELLSNVLIGSPAKSK